MWYRCQVINIKGGPQKSLRLPDVVRQVLEEILPISGLPESEPFHLCVIVTHWGVAVRGALKVYVHEFFQVCTNNLVCVNEDDFLEVHWEEDIQEENFVGPDNTLFFSLSTQPRWPLVRDEFILEAVLLGHVRYELLRTL